MAEGNDRNRPATRRRAALVAAVGATALGGVAATGLLVSGGASHQASAGRVAAHSGVAASAPVAQGNQAGGGVQGMTSKRKREQCRTVDRYIPYHSALHLQKIQWHSSVRYCWTGKKVRIVRASSYLKPESSTITADPKPNRVVYNKKHSAVTVMVSSDVAWNTPWGATYNHPKVQYRMWAINGAHTYKPISTS
ncbi:hypothetical protein BKA00_000532 [Actinomadura coerulea]|uniref:Uncharacterized protein n=1 Tax=Actinomadura coerulea TaxID=46159 RepID=A0A7X0KWT6_9ACTN|nr:hypothetical protein [Actinomadura coerulea]MBB6393618.1 hypothetical protein [Actinomadura coerulea]GGP91567.1 hypothetical protein GCM10010187_03680 [Actinomadura coerulea]